MNLATLPDQRAERDPLGPSVADDNASLTNAEFLDAVVRAAAALQARGVSAGDVVAIMLPNTASFVVSLFAAWRLGAAATTDQADSRRGRNCLPGLRRRSEGADCGTAPRR